MDDMTIKTVIFDLDGTITQPCFDFDAIRMEMGFARDAGPVLELMQRMAPDKRRQADKILLAHEQRAVDISALNAGAVETLSAIHEAGLPIGILTRNLKENAVAIARKHDLHFDFIVGREEGPAKPDPFGVLHICQAFAVPPREAMVVGDYLFDLVCARSAGAIPVWFRNSKATEDYSSSADYTIDALPQLLSIIAAANSNKEKANA
jgi:HAD superfamily hydrolase (TIGR01549 family)